MFNYKVLQVKTTYFWGRWLFLPQFNIFCFILRSAVISKIRSCRGQAIIGTSRARVFPCFYSAFFLADEFKFSRFCE